MQRRMGARLGWRIVWELLRAVLPLALGAAITPTLFALQVLVVSGPRWQARATAVVLGTAMVFAVVTAAVLGSLSQLPDAGTGGPSRYEYIAQTVCGALLLGMAVWMLRPHPSADDRMERKVQGYAAHASPTVFAGLAAYMSITDFSSLVLLVPALHDVTRSAVPVFEKALVVAFLMACLLAPVLVPVLAVRVAGHRGLDVLRRVYSAVMGHQIQVMGAVSLVLGMFLLWRGVRGL